MADEKQPTNDNQNDQFEAREKAIPNQLAQLMSDFCDSQTHAEYNNRINYAHFLKLINELGNINRDIVISLIGLDQPLSAKLSTPLSGQVDKRYYGLSKSSFKQSFAVSAHREQNENLKVGVKDETEAHAEVGGLAAILGGGGGISNKLTATTTYTKETRRASDYQSHTEVEAEMERFDAPEGVAILDEAEADLIHGAVDANKVLVERQKDILIGQAGEADLNVAQDADTEATGDGDTQDASTSGDDDFGFNEDAN